MYIHKFYHITTHMYICSYIFVNIGKLHIEYYILHIKMLSCCYAYICILYCYYYTGKLHIDGFIVCFDVSITNARQIEDQVSNFLFFYFKTYFYYK